jgi:hypothetical protein
MKEETMKCQFCNQRCVQIKATSPDYNKYNIQYVCKNHVIQPVSIVEVRRYHVRGNYDTIGELRLLQNTILSWPTNNKQYYLASFWRNENQEPGYFTVVKSNKADWSGAYGQSVLYLEEYPKDITPENIINKVKTYIVFS